MAATMTSQNIDLSSWDTLYNLAADSVARYLTKRFTTYIELVLRMMLHDHEANMAS
jgi:hypothetical protein